jgi:hypothetical protein
MKSHEAATTPAEIENLLALEEGITKGPWQVHSREPLRVVLSEWTETTVVRTHNGMFSDEQNERNARAIAALPQLFTTLRALYARAIKAEAENDEAYELGKRDGYIEAVQDIDMLTGGDGEYFASTIPGRGCEDADAMKQKIAERFEAVEAALVDHNDLLRSAFQAAQRDAIHDVAGTTNYRTLADRASEVLAKHHATTNAARAAAQASAMKEGV